MKKVLPLLIFVVVAGAALYLVFKSKSTPSSTAPGTSQQASAALSDNTSKRDASSGLSSPPNPAGAPEASEDGEESVAEDTRSAAEVYSSADQALEAVKKAAADYDDLVLEQFTKPGPDCTWCDQFYASVKDLIASKDTPQEAKGYYAELLAVSGKVENLNSLVDSIKSATDPQEADLFAEALELSTGGEDTVKYLGSQMDSKNELVQEASIAAVTNQGTRVAAELLYNQTVKSGDPDGYYSKGIGLGEFIPDADSLPYLQELVKKQDQYSPLAVKALINSGMDGLRIVFDEIASVKDPEARKKMLSGAEDHVNYEEGVEAYLQKISETTKQTDVADWAKKVLADFKSSAEENEAGDPLMSIDPNAGMDDASGSAE